MGRIIHCADLIIRVEEDTVIGNLTNWILESTDFRPTAMETCTISDEMGTYQKLWLIGVVWITLVVLSFLYCYFCEQRLFHSSKKLFDPDQAGSRSANPLAPTLPPKLQPNGYMSSHQFARYLRSCRVRSWTGRDCWRMGDVQTKSATRSTKGS